MAQIIKTTKSQKKIIEDVQLCGVGQNLADTSKVTTRKLSVYFKKENGTDLCFSLLKEEVTFIKNQINKFEEEKLNNRKFKHRINTQAGGAK